MTAVSALRRSEPVYIASETAAIRRQTLYPRARRVAWWATVAVGEEGEEKLDTRLVRAQTEVEGLGEPVVVVCECFVIAPGVDGVMV